MNRRGFVSALLAAPLLVWTGDLLAKATQYPGLPSQSSPQFPGGYPPGVRPFPPAAKLDPHAVLVENQKKIKKDVKRLYELAGKLRKQVNRTDSSEILSLDMIDTAEKIERLAKHIRDLARG